MNHEIPDLISIDVDGDEYYILKGLKRYLPRILIIEYNPTIPPHIELIQEEGEFFGCSAKAMVRLAFYKGYILTYITKSNLIFVRKDLFERVGIAEEKLDAKSFPNDTLTYVISSYDGTPMIVGNPPYSNLQRMEEVAVLGNYQSKVARLKPHRSNVVTPIKIFKQ